MAVEGGRGRVFTDLVEFSSVTRAEVRQVLSQHLCNNLVQLGPHRFYLQTRGIPQGSLVSSMLCCCVYAHLEEHRLRPLPSLHLNQPLSAPAAAALTRHPNCHVSHRCASGKRADQRTRGGVCVQRPAVGGVADEARGDGEEGWETGKKEGGEKGKGGGRVGVEKGGGAKRYQAQRDGASAQHNEGSSGVGAGVAGGKGAQGTRGKQRRSKKARIACPPPAPPGEGASVGCTAEVAQAAAGGRRARGEGGGGLGVAGGMEEGGDEVHAGVGGEGGEDKGAGGVDSIDAREASLLLRVVDDFLYISADLGLARAFVRTMACGHSDYGLEVNVDKSRVNFDVQGRNSEK